METNELMPGDWVRIKGSITPDDAYWMHDNLHPGQAIRVEEILSYGINPDFYDGEINDYIPEDAIEPIPLTPEILEKNFTRTEVRVLVGTKTHYIESDDFFDVALNEYTDSIWEFEYTNNEANFPFVRMFIAHVHELQHALKLCGINKEIVL